MPRTNASGGTIITVNLGEQLALLDQLPLRWKELVWVAPTALDLREIAAVRDQLGEAGLPAVVDLLAKLYPGWEFVSYEPKRGRRRGR